MTWYSQSGPRRKDSGKFRAHARMGSEKSASGKYRDWSYTFVAHQTASGVRRTRYAVSISDSHQNKVKYLRDFSNLDQATTAAKECIDELLDHKLSLQRAGEVGKIPPLPLTAITDRIAE